MFYFVHLSIQVSVCVYVWNMHVCEFVHVAMSLSGHSWPGCWLFMLLYVRNFPCV